MTRTKSNVLTTVQGETLDPKTGLSPSEVRGFPLKLPSIPSTE